MAEHTTSVFLRHGTSALRLVVVEGGAVHDYPLPARGKLVIGRSTAADIRLEDTRVSREHLCLHVGEELEIEDLDSVNGTILHNQLITARRRIRIAPSDAVTVGSVVLIVQPADAAGETPLATTSPGAEQSFASILVPGVLVEDPRMRRVYELAARVALGDVNVLILGESGTGKELVATAVHRCSRRAEKPFVSFSCAALPESLLENELFGHERGAFTGANQDKQGILECAPGGTLFLDEVGEMSPAVQAKLLRVLETKELLRVGGHKPRRIDVRFVSATNRRLSDEVLLGHFRRDLYFRLNTVTIEVPPLRERRGEILPLASHFIATLSAADAHESIPRLSVTAERALEAHSWPGNVRELRGAIQRALLLCDGEILPEHLALETWSSPTTTTVAIPTRAGVKETFHTEVAELERRRILEALEACNGNQTRAAERLGIARRTLLKRLDEYGLPRPRKRSTE